MTVLVLVLKKIKNKDKTKYGTFYSHSKAETVTNESDIDDNVFMLQLYQKYKIFYEKLDFWFSHRA